MNNKNETLIDVFELKDDLLFKNGKPVICPISPAAMIPKNNAIAKQYLEFEERYKPCGRICPHAMLFKVVKENDQIKYIYQTRCVPGWPQIELNKI